MKSVLVLMCTSVTALLCVSSTNVAIGKTSQDMRAGSNNPSRPDEGCPPHRCIETRIEEPAVPPLPIPKQDVRSVCEYVASRGSMIADTLVFDGILDGNNDGKKDRVSIYNHTGGHYRSMLGLSPSLSQDKFITYEDDVSSHVRGMGWLPYKGKVFTVYTLDEEFKYPSSIGYIDRNNYQHTLCTLTLDVVEHIDAANAESQDVCNAVRSGKVQYLDVIENRSSEAGREVIGFVDVDFDNSGKQQKLWLFNGAGSWPPCEFQNYFLTSNPQNADFNSPSGALGKAQNWGCLFNQPRWFHYNGKYYFDDKGGQADDKYRNVSLIKGEGVSLECKSRFDATKWRVNSFRH